jgi:hypothetical protein
MSAMNVVLEASLGMDRLNFPERGRVISLASIQTLELSTEMIEHLAACDHAGGYVWEDVKHCILTSNLVLANELLADLRVYGIKIEVVP